LPRE